MSQGAGPQAQLPLPVPPPPAPDSRLPYPPPPGLAGPAPVSAPPGSWPGEAGPGQPSISDTQRMLAPQGLFQARQPWPGDPYQQPGQYPPPGGYPPGGGFAPNGFPPQPGRLSGRLKLPKGPLGPAIVAAALVLVIAGAVALAIPGGGGGGASAGSSGSGPSVSGSSGAGANPAQKQAAMALSSLLPQSGIYHADVNAAVGNVQSCGKDLAKDARIFNKSAANRRTLLAKLTALPGRGALPAALVGDLTSAWQASAEVDSDLGKWAATAAQHCRSGNPNDPNLAASAGPESTATNSKQAFAKQWNPLARKYGLPTIQGVQL